MSGQELAPFLPRASLAGSPGLGGRRLLHATISKHTLKQLLLPVLGSGAGLVPPVSPQGERQGPGHSWHIPLLAASLVLMLWQGGVGQPCFAGMLCLL